MASQSSFVCGVFCWKLWLLRLFWCLVCLTVNLKNQNLPTFRAFLTLPQDNCKTAGSVSMITSRNRIRKPEIIFTYRNGYRTVLGIFVLRAPTLFWIGAFQLTFELCNGHVLPGVPDPWRFDTDPRIRTTAFWIRAWILLSSLMAFKMAKHFFF